MRHSVLATRVGGVSDVIRDNETGFIMEEHSPDGIAGNILRALNHAHLQEVAQNAHNFVRQEFTYDKAVEKWRDILSRL